MDSHSLLNTLYRDSLALHTDLYELTMARGYWKEGLQDREAVFQLFFRKKPFQGSFAICAGIETALEYIEKFRFSEGDLAYLATIKDPLGTALFEDGFLRYLQDFRLQLDVDAMEEGTPVFPFEPLLRVQGPIIQAQIIESALLNIVNFQTLIATKGARIAHAAKGDHVVEFGLRRAQGIDGAISASRAAFIGGCHSTSNVLAGKLFGIPVMGTHAHSWVMTFEDEKEAFRAFARAFPNNCVFLIDTYDTMKGLENAIIVAKELQKEGIPLRALRLDSGDLSVLSQKVRRRLDQAGFSETKIMATNELTEEIITNLKYQGADISIWGVGTNLVTAKDQPALDGVYKLSALKNERGEWTDRLKISDQVIKTTHPGISQVRRYSDGERDWADMVYDLPIGAGNTIVHHTDPGKEWEVDPSWEHRDLLIPMLRRGKRVYTSPPLSEIRENTISQLSRLPSSMRRFLNPEPFFSGMEKRLMEKKLRMIREIQKR